MLNTKSFCRPEYKFRPWLLSIKCMWQSCDTEIWTEFIWYQTQVWDWFYYTMQGLYFTQNHWLSLAYISQDDCKTVWRNTSVLSNTFLYLKNYWLILLNNIRFVIFFAFPSDINFPMMCFFYIRHTLCSSIIFSGLMVE